MSEKWTPVPGKPHFYRNERGQLKYAPPIPPLPVPSVFEFWQKQTGQKP